MIGDQIHIAPEYYATSLALYQHFHKIYPRPNKIVIAIAGESGSGKSVTATCFKRVLNNHDIPTITVHMDDFFHLPPHTNHMHRLASFDNVGYQEVAIDKLSELIQQFKSDAPSVEKPLVHYNDNKITEEIIQLEAIEALIIEGTYSFLATGIDLKIFMERDFKQTKTDRIERNRGNESNDPFVEKVLEKEHTLIAPFIHQADLLICTDFSVKQLVL